MNTLYNIIDSSEVRFALQVLLVAFIGWLAAVLQKRATDLHIMSKKVDKTISKVDAVHDIVNSERVRMANEILTLGDEVRRLTQERR